MTCAQCGAPLRPGAMFCGECGARVELTTPPPAPAPTPLVEPAVGRAGTAGFPPPPTASPPPPPAPSPLPPAPPPVPTTPGGWTPPAPPPPPVPASSSIAVQEEVAGAQPTVPVQRLIDNLPLGLLDRGTPGPVPTFSPPPEPSIGGDVESGRELGAGDLEETVIAPRRSARWRIVTPAGDHHTIAGPTVIGRSPVALAGTVALALVDPTKSLSKSHALLEIAGDGLVIEDLGSTNGVIAHDGTVEIDLQRGQRLDLRPGMSLELGEYVLLVEHG